MGISRECAGIRHSLSFHMRNICSLPWSCFRFRIFFLRNLLYLDGICAASKFCAALCAGPDASAYALDCTIIAVWAFLPWALYHLKLVVLDLVPRPVARSEPFCRFYFFNVFCHFDACEVRLPGLSALAFEPGSAGPKPARINQATPQPLAELEI